MTYTLPQLAKEFLSVIAVTSAPGTVENYRRLIYRWLKTVKGKSIDALKPIDLLRWGKTWHEIQAVQRLFGWAVDEAELVPRHPFRGVRKPPLGQRKRTLTRKQMATLCRAASRCFRDVLIAMRETIARPQEIRGLAWEQLHSNGQGDDKLQWLRDGCAFFVLQEYKARSRRKDPNKPRLILISPRLARLLLRLAKGRRDLAGPIFANSKGQPWTSNAVRLRMMHLRERLKMKPDSSGENIVAYSVRHTQATAAAAAGVRDRILAELMGHTSTRTTARYQHLEYDHLRAAFARLHAC